ncbi:MAG: FAD-binding oxidoreductase [Fimbriimonas sp.]
MSTFKGEWFTADDPGFKAAAHGQLWNQLRPTRMPEIVARVVDDQDVIYAVNYAREHGLKVVVRGGGHNWCCPSLRDGGLLIDLSRMIRILSIDADARLAVVEPIVSNREIIAALKPYGLAYPTGHCPEVKMSGYLLSGGMSWNHGVWGPGVGSVEAIEMVTAEGKLITADREQNRDLFWAARGAGPGFCAICVRYHLRLYELPKTIACSLYYFPAEDIVSIADWLGPLADRLTPNVELSLWMVAAPDHLKEHGKVSLVTATVFANSQEDAEEAVRPLEGAPMMDRCLSRSFACPSSFEEIFDASGALWPSGLRCNVDAMFSNASLSDVFESVREHYLSAPRRAVLMFAVYTGGSAPAPPSDAAFSVTGKLYGGPWTMWDEPSEDAAGIAWHDRCVALLEPLMHAHYVSETDTAGHPEFIKKAYASDNLARIEQIRQQRDPDALFFDYREGLG